MFLHLGKNAIIHLEDVIAILDAESSSESKYTCEFLKTADEEGFITAVSQGKPKSIVITDNSKNRRKRKRTGTSAVYYSPISSTTLSKRAGYMYDI
jgi:hypothetical protein